MSVDMNELSKTLIKTKKTISHQPMFHPIIDEEINFLTLKDEQKEVNDQLNMELLSKDFDIKINSNLIDLVGDFNDEVSLFNQVGG